MYLMLWHSSSLWGISWGSLPAPLQWDLRMLLLLTALISLVCMGRARDCVSGMFWEMDNHQACKWLAWFKDDTTLLGPSESPSRQRLVQVTEGPRLSSCPIPVLSQLTLSDHKILTILKIIISENRQVGASGLAVLGSKGKKKMKVQHQEQGLIDWK